MTASRIQSTSIHLDFHCHISIRRLENINKLRNMNFPHSTERHATTVFLGEQTQNDSSKFLSNFPLTDQHCLTAPEHDWSEVKQIKIQSILPSRALFHHQWLQSLPSMKYDSHSSEFNFIFRPRQVLPPGGGASALTHSLIIALQ